MLDVRVRAYSDVAGWDVYTTFALILPAGAAVFANARRALPAENKVRSCLWLALNVNSTAHL
eukprot:5023760-Amphidinium_carterae.2